MQLSARIEKGIFIFIGLLLFYLSYLIYTRMHDLITSYQMVYHTKVVQEKLEKAVSYVKDAETSQRGFLLTHDSAYLTPFYGASPKSMALLDELKLLILDNPRQQANLSRLEALINYRFHRLNNSLNNIGNRKGLKDIDTGLSAGRRVMDSIRWQLNVMLQEEARLLTQREQTKNRYVFVTPLFLLSLILVSLTILAFAFYRINHQLKVSLSYATQLAEKNKELNQKNKELENSNEELQSFNYVASHDLREPLRKIKTFTSLILSDHSLSSQTRHYATRVDAVGTHMQMLLDDLLAYSRLSMGERPMENVNLNELLKDIQQNMQEVLEETRTVIRYESLPVVNGVRFQLQQLFENLLSNSIKYQKPGNIPRIEVTSETVRGKDLPEKLRHGHSCFTRLRVSDNGIGFDQKYADKIFSPFQRLHARKEYHGTGIGLTICKKIVDNHEGLITVSSQENQGTAFDIFLPCSVA